MCSQFYAYLHRPQTCLPALLRPWQRFHLLCLPQTQACSTFIPWQRSLFFLGRRRRRHLGCWRARVDWAAAHTCWVVQEVCSWLILPFASPPPPRHARMLHMRGDKCPTQALPPAQRNVALSLPAQSTLFAHVLLIECLFCLLHTPTRGGQRRACTL